MLHIFVAFERPSNFYTYVKYLCLYVHVVQRQSLQLLFKNYVHSISVDTIVVHVLDHVYKKNVRQQ